MIFNMQTFLRTTALFIVTVLFAILIMLSRPAHAEQSAGEYFAAENARGPAPVMRPRKARGFHAPAHKIQMVTDAARRHGVPVNIAHAVIMAESGYRCDARSPSNAKGIAQVLPATARGLGIHGNLYDCATGLEAGMRYLRLAIDRGGATCAGVSLYERGIYARPVCSGYGRKVMSLASN